MRPRCPWRTAPRPDLGAPSCSNFRPQIPAQTGRVRAPSAQKAPTHSTQKTAFGAWPRPAKTDAPPPGKRRRRWRPRLWRPRRWRLRLQAHLMPPPRPPDEPQNRTPCPGGSFGSIPETGDWDPPSTDGVQRAPMRSIPHATRREVPPNNTPERKFPLRDHPSKRVEKAGVCSAGPKHRTGAPPTNPRSR